MRCKLEHIYHCFSCKKTIIEEDENEGYWRHGEVCSCAGNLIGVKKNSNENYEPLSNNIVFKTNVEV